MTWDLNHLAAIGLLVLAARGLACAVSDISRTIRRVRDWHIRRLAP